MSVPARIPFVGVGVIVSRDDRWLLLRRKAHTVKARGRRLEAISTSVSLLRIARDVKRPKKQP